VAGRSTSSKRRFEREYPYRVDVPSQANGLGKKLDSMNDWCRQHSRDWQSYGARFYFKDEADAAAFRQRWLEAQ
jgi:hypothetical protein